MDSLDKLTNLFEKFPGIGARQARRFAYFILSKDASYTEELSMLIKNIKKDITQCSECLRFFAKSYNEKSLCSICSSEKRDKSLLLLVAKDSDLSAIEKGGIYKGCYFVLGGIVPILEKEPERKIRLVSLEKKIIRAKEEGLSEIILALSATSEGENTEDFLKERLRSFGIKVSVLGRGISSGTEIEYIDTETLKGALENKK